MLLQSRQASLSSSGKFKFIYKHTQIDASVIWMLLRMLGSVWSRGGYSQWVVVQPWPEFSWKGIWTCVPPVPHMPEDVPSMCLPFTRHTIFPQPGTPWFLPSSWPKCSCLEYVNLLEVRQGTGLKPGSATHKLNNLGVNSKTDNTSAI